MRETVRHLIELSLRHDSALENLVDKLGISKSAVVERALALLATVEAAKGRRRGQAPVMANVGAAIGLRDRGGAGIPCYVLSDGSTVMSTAQIQRVLGASGNRMLTQMVNRISSDSTALSVQPISFNLKTGGSANGYSGEDLVDICSAYQKAVNRPQRS